MLTKTPDHFKQLAIRSPAVVLAPRSARPFSAGRGLLTEAQFQLPPAHERTVASILSRKVMMPKPGVSFTTELELLERTTTFVTREPLRGPSTLQEAPATISPRTAEPIPPERDALPFLVAVRRFIETEQLSTARRMLEAAPFHILSDPLVARLRSILAPPVVKRTKKQDIDRSLEFEWLRRQSHKYRGRWVALEGNQVLAVASRLRELREQLRTMSLTHPPLIHRVD